MTEQHRTTYDLIDEIAVIAEVSYESVKRVLYCLLALRYIKAVFRPRHKICGKVLGDGVGSVHEVKEGGPYSCLHCSEYVEREDVAVEILFKSLGT